MDKKYYCFYKTSSCLGLLVSEDLKTWQEASPDRPLLSRKDIPDHPDVENVNVIPEENGNGWRMFFSPTYKKRGIGVAFSSDLLHWEFSHYLEFPKFNWGRSGPTAPSILDTRKICGKWLMAFHGEYKWPLDAALGLAWSDDLEHWEFHDRKKQVGKSRSL
jgi:predicted GH43/DUF377 family glycosyl hydrolase